MSDLGEPGENKPWSEDRSRRLPKKHHRASVALCGIAGVVGLSSVVGVFLPGWIAFCFLVLSCSALVWRLR